MASALYTYTGFPFAYFQVPVTWYLIKTLYCMLTTVFILINSPSLINAPSIFNREEGENLPKRARVDKRLFWPQIFLKFEVSYFCVVYIHIIKAKGHSYQHYAQTSVCMFTVATETPPDKVKMTFFMIFNIFLLFRKLLIKILIQHHARTNTKFLS